jgi:ADP-dependent NAD(P)H-hydrate dehydratase / NAD(P)H-hydrate epimerase
MKILTAEQMRALDRQTVERCSIPYATLMETAGSRVVEAIIENYGSVKDKYFLVFCGKGNNGGDGAVIARLLWLRGAKVAVYLLGALDDTKGEARINFESVKRIADKEELREEEGLPQFELEQVETEELAASYNESYCYPITDFVVDAIFGTGMTREAQGLYAKVIEYINNYRRDNEWVRVIAVDIPSGLSSDSSNLLGAHVDADLTVSFTAPKIGNVLPPASETNGKLVIASIGTPNWLIEEAGAQLELVEEGQITDWLNKSRRPPDAHKSSVGDVLLIAGSRGKTGAAALSAETILRAGAGLVTVATAQSAQVVLVNQLINEAMTEGLPETEDGAIAREALAPALKLAQKRTVIALGPGLSSRDEGTRHFVRKLVAQRSAPMVIDADGLNALAPWPDDLQGTDELPIIITPHPGEMARLIGKTNAEVQADRINVAREFATKHKVITVLKGSRSLIAAPDGEVYVNPTGNAGMATAGSGDVLTGLIAGLLAQRPDDALDATIAGVYLHGLAGDLAAEKLGMRSLIASDIIAHLSRAILQVGGAAERGTRQSITRL